MRDSYSHPTLPSNLHSYVDLQRLENTDLSTLVTSRRLLGHAKVRCPLQMASMNGHVESTRLLLHLGVDVDARDRQGRTAVHFAVMFSHHEVFELLLCYGSDPTATDIAGNTPLSLAAMNGLNQAIMLLIEWGALL